jgi:hypothetical protein
MNARRLILAAVVSLSSLAVGGLFAAPAALAEELCPNAASRQGPSVALPDCRVYEQVTPVDKGDATDMFGNEAQAGSNTAVFPAEDGDHLLYISESAFPQGGDAYFSAYVFSRGPEGWSTTSLSPGPGVYYQKPSIVDPENLSEVGVENILHPHTLYEQDFSFDVGPPGGPYTALPGGGTEAEETWPVGASADLSHIILESRDHELAPGDTGQNVGNADALYELSGGHLNLVNVNTNGSLISPCGATLGTAGNPGPYNVEHSAVSKDGSKVIFTVPGALVGEPTFAAPGCWNGWSRFLTQEENEEAQENAPQLYMRIDGDQTVEISAPNANVHDALPPQPAVFVGASADGSKVFFISRGQLTADDTTHANQLYEYDLEAPAGERLVRVTSGESGTAEGNVDYVGAVSSDGSMVYFEASSKLAEGAPAAGGLYGYDIVTKKTTFIAPYAAYPFYKGNTQFASAAWFGEYLGGSIEGSQGDAPAVPESVGLMRNATWDVTGDGQYLVFPVEVGGGSSGSGEKLLRYDAADKSLVCVTCANGVQASTPTFGEGLYEQSAPPMRAMSEDGSYVFFETSTALVPNTTEQVKHVYEWHEGKISLISSPDDPSNAFLLGVSSDGSNVFIGTHAQLTAADTDFSGDIYDARIDGGFVKLTPSLCTGTGCQGVPAAPPIFATPASVTFEGVGNFPPGTVAPNEQTVKPGSPTGGKKLAKALKACKRERAKHRRVRCEASARARYSRVHKSNESNRRGN